MQDVAGGAEKKKKERVKALGKSVKFNPLCMQAVCKHKYMRNIQMNHTLTLFSVARNGFSRWKHQLSSKNPDSKGASDRKERKKL